VSNDPFNAIDGHVYHWKSHMLLGGVTATAVDTAAVAASSDLFDLRGLQYNAADHSITVQVWGNPLAASGSLDFSVDSAAATRVTFTSALGAEWTTLANEEGAGNLNVGAFATDTSYAGAIGALNIGTVKIELAAGQTAATVNFSNLAVGNTAAAGFALNFSTQTTAGSGAFELGPLPEGSYGLSLARGTTDSSNAVSSADALAALRIAVGANPNTGTLKVSPYQFIAADANEDGRITSADALAILRMAVKAPTAPAQEWHFVNESLDLWNEAAGLSALTRSSTAWDPAVNVQLAQDTTLNYVGVLKGDVNGSWAAPAGSTDLDTTRPDYFQLLGAQLGVPTDVFGF
jgi:hypothetical protein